jgi:hypothetical protein
MEKLTHSEHHNFALFAIQYQDNQTKEDEMDAACSTHGRDEKDRILVGET